VLCFENYLYSFAIATHTHQLLRSLNVRELLKCAWMKDGWKQAPSVQRHTLHFNRLAAWVGCEILLAANADVRLKVRWKIHTH
jgi:hypothetical protein